jgi:hypothetical protein
MTWRGLDRLRPSKLTARTPKRIKPSPETTPKVRDSFRIKAEDRTPMTGTPIEPIAVFMAGRSRETVRKAQKQNPDAMGPL